MTSTPTHDEVSLPQQLNNIRADRGMMPTGLWTFDPEKLVAFVVAREKLIREQADTWWITTNMKQNGKKLLGPFSSRDLALSVRTYMEIAEAPATYWVEQLNSSKTKLKKEG